MTRFGVSIEKQTNFRGVQQPFANVYHYELPYNPTDVSQLDTFLNALVVREKVIHASVVSFIRGRVWNTGSGTQAGNQMRVDKALSGVGSGNDTSTWDRERAILIRWPAGTNSRGKPVYLRKWYHTCGNWGSLTIPTGLLGNTAPWGSANQTIIENFADTVQTLDIGGIPIGALCGPGGRATTGEGQAHPWLEHHQLGDQWR